MSLEIPVLLSRRMRILSAFRNFTLLPSRSRSARHPRMAFADATQTDGSDGVTAPAAVAVFRQALVTFPPSNDFPSQLEKLRQMMSQLRAEDLGLDPIFSDPSLWKSSKKPPCTYIEVFQNQDINMSIFVLGPGFKMPLHDHPEMHGLLKVVSGAVNIRSYTEDPVAEEAQATKMETRSDAKRAQTSSSKRRKFIAKITSTVTCRETTECCVLTPTTSNFHEIEALDSPAAFIDILAPPYDTPHDKATARRCSYYRVVSEVGKNLVEMQEIDVPDDFYCDQAPYLGPLLSN